MPLTLVNFGKVGKILDFFWWLLPKPERQR